jgi:hypothetical protein
MLLVNMESPTISAYTLYWSFFVQYSSPQFPGLASSKRKRTQGRNDFFDPRRYFKPLLPHRPISISVSKFLEKKALFALHSLFSEAMDYLSFINKTSLLKRILAFKQSAYYDHLYHTET